MKKVILLTAVLLSISFVSSASALILPDPDTDLDHIGTQGPPAALLYGDFYSYSLPILAYDYSLEHYGDVTPNHLKNGNPFFVDSQPGQIKNEIVLGTGSNGAEINDNPAGMDDAFSTNTNDDHWETVNATEPGGVEAFTGDQAGTWDTSLSSLMTYLGRNNADATDDSPLVFFWNNNEEGSGGPYTTNQDLNGWARVSIIKSADADGSETKNFFVRNPLSIAPYYPPGADDWALSPGRVCLSATTGAIINCATKTAADYEISHNLGANQAVFALYSPIIDLNLEAWILEGFDAMQIDFRIKDIDNGYEQLFIKRINGIAWEHNPVPEPATMVLLGSGLLGLAGFARKRKK